MLTESQAQTILHPGVLLRQGWRSWMRIYAVDGNCVTVRRLWYDQHQIAWHPQKKVVVYSGWFARLIGTIIWRLLEFRQKKESQV